MLVDGGDIDVRGWGKADVRGDTGCRRNSEGVAGGKAWAHVRAVLILGVMTEEMPGLMMGAGA